MQVNVTQTQISPVSQCPRSQVPGAMIDEWWCWLQRTAGVSPPRAAAGATNSYH